MLSAYKKILDNVVSKKESRPVLKGVHYENGNAVATDSHQLVLFKDVVEDKELNATIDLSTYLPIYDRYPDTDHLIPVDHTTQLIFHDLDELTELVSYLKSAKKNIVDLDINGAGFGLELHDDREVNYIQEANWDGEILTVRFNANYLYNALAYLDRLHKDQPLEYSGDVTINFNGELRPFTVEYGKMTYLICPVRVFN